MFKLSFERLQTWLSESGYALDGWIPRLATHSDTVSIEMPVPKGVQLVTELLDDLVDLDEGTSKWVIWVRDSTIWDERSQENGLRHLALVTALAETGNSMTTGEIYELSSSERKDAIAVLMVPVMYSWDAHFFYSTGRALVDISHHGTITVQFSESDKQLAAKLQPWQAATQ